MKNLFFAICAILLVSSCGTSKTVRDSKKIIKGEWNLTSINTSAIGNFSLTLLNDASKACFKNSSWEFIPNNNTGTYALNGPDCNSEKKYFSFAISEINEVTGLYDFLLKPTDKRANSETNIGFRLRLTSLSDSDMQWQQTVTSEGTPIIITMNFKKI